MNLLNLKSNQKGMDEFKINNGLTFVLLKQSYHMASESMEL